MNSLFIAYRSRLSLLLPLCHWNEISGIFFVLMGSPLKEYDSTRNSEDAGSHGLRGF